MSRKGNPKQFIEVVDERTLIQNTVARLQGIIPPERCFIVTNERYVQQTHDQLPAIPRENILAEPIARNTAPCIAYAAYRIQKLDPDATMVVLPADHVIQNVRLFHDALNKSIEAAKRDGALVTIGITPPYPATGYGYIQFDGTGGTDKDDVPVFPVRTFAEKPGLETAERFVDSGDFLWNSGMFIWRVGSIMDAFREHLGKVASAFDGIASEIGTDTEPSAVQRAYAACPNISIDYGVMERSEHVFVVPGTFDWSDVGDWRAVYDLQEKNSNGNVMLGNALAQDSRNCMIKAGDRLVAVVGVEDIIVVDTGDATLVCHQAKTQQVKQVVDYLNSERLESFL